MRNWGHVLLTGLLGNPALFAPRALGGGRGEARSLYDNGVVAGTLASLIDFDRINRGDTRLCLACTDVERGEAVFFDTARGDRIGPEHVIASSSLLPAFEPVRIGDRLLGDGGLCCNLPLEAEIGPERPGAPEPTCIAIDLFAAKGPQAPQLNRAVERSIDLMFGMQTRQRLAGLEREWALHDALAAAATGDGMSPRAGVDLFLMTYRAPDTDAGFGKPFDFSPATLADRWRAGQAAAERVLAESDGIADGRRGGADDREQERRPGLRVHRVS